MTEYLHAAEPPASDQGIDWYGLRIDEPGGIGSTVEPDLWRVCSNLFRQGDVILVGGGGIGTLSALLAWKYGNRNVWTVEPNPEMVAFMQHNIRIKRQPLQIEQGALCSKAGDVELSIGDWWGMSSTAQDVGDKLIVVGGIEANNFIRRHRITALALDIEGAEGDILLDLDYSPIRALAVELHPPCDVRAICSTLTDVYGSCRLDRCHGPYGLLVSAEVTPPYREDMQQRAADVFVPLGRDR